MLLNFLSRRIESLPGGEVVGSAGSVEWQRSPYEESNRDPLVRCFVPWKGMEAWCRGLAGRGLGEMRSSALPEAESMCCVISASSGCSGSKDGGRENVKSGRVRIARLKAPGSCLRFAGNFRDKAVKVINA